MWDQGKRRAVEDICRICGLPGPRAGSCFFEWRRVFAPCITAGQILATKTAPEGAVFYSRLLTKGEQAAGLFVFQVGVALQTQLQLVEQGLAGRVVQRRVETIR